jgi:hypothetical protein
VNGVPNPEPPRRKLLTVLLWAVMLAIPAGGIIGGIGITSYWTVKPFRVIAEGDPLFAFDPETGYVARPNSSTIWTALGPNDSPIFRYHAYTDQRGARVSVPGRHSGDQSDILVLGDSFAWGHGVENEDTFAFTTIAALAGSGANFAAPSYGTTQSLQLLRRYRNLAPKLVIFTLVQDHLWRNISACTRSAYPFCLDVAHVAWDRQGRAYIARPSSDGVARLRLHMRADRQGLDPWNWIVHGVDVAIARVRYQMANDAALDAAKQNAALTFLIEQMAFTTREMNATLLVVFLPDVSMLPTPEVLANSAARLGYAFLDLRPVFMRMDETNRRSLFLKDDGHPSPAGHGVIARELIAFIRGKRLLAGGP